MTDKALRKDETMKTINQISSIISIRSMTKRCSRNERDVAIIGGGPAAIYAAYEFALKYPDIKVVILEEGHAIDFRNCPIIAGKTEQCVRCTPCSIMRGFGGAGAFSDGKYNLRRNLAAG